jgi:hypothetical protein
MIVKLKGEDGKENPFNPSLTVEAAQPNKRLGLFGTAIENNDDAEEFAPVGRSVQAVSFRDSNDSRQFKHKNDRGKGGKPAVQGRRPNQAFRKPVKKEKAVDGASLDDELDRYMTKR